MGLCLLENSRWIRVILEREPEKWFADKLDGTAGILQIQDIFVRRIRNSRHLLVHVPFLLCDTVYHLAIQALLWKKVTRFHLWDTVFQRVCVVDSWALSWVLHLHLFPYFWNKFQRWASFCLSCISSDVCACSLDIFQDLGIWAKDIETSPENVGIVLLLSWYQLKRFFRLLHHLHHPKNSFRAHMLQSVTELTRNCRFSLDYLEHNRLGPYRSLQANCW